MFNITLWVILTALCIPGTWLVSKFAAKDLLAKPDNKLSERSLLLLLSGQTLFIAALCVAVGIYFGPKVGLTDRFLTELSYGNLVWPDLFRQLWVGTIAGLICAFGWIVSYYGFFRSRIDRASVLISEKTRQQLGMAARITSGGITEEIIFRWGLLPGAMWLISLITPSLTAAFWIAVFVTGILFGLAHLPGNFEKGCKPAPMLIATALLGNMWVTIFCGYLFWQYGFIAAIVVHMLFHIVWYPWDRAAFRKLSASSPADTSFS